MIFHFKVHNFGEGGADALCFYSPPPEAKKTGNEALSWMRSHVPQFGQIVRCILLLFLLYVLSPVVGVFHDLDFQMMLQQQKRVEQRLEMSHV